MFFMSVNRKVLGVVALVIVLFFAVFIIYSTGRISENRNMYESVLCMTRMFEDTHFIAYIYDVTASSVSKNIEVFDISKGKVIINQPINADIQNEVSNYVKSVKSVYTKVMPFPEKGYVIRCPFDPPIKTREKLLNDAGIKVLDSVFIIISDKEAPILLVLDSQQRPNFYTFNSNIQPLLDYVKLIPYEAKAMDVAVG